MRKVNVIERLDYNFKSDGGLESLVIIVKYYKGNEAKVDLLNRSLSRRNPQNTFSNLVSIAKYFGLLGVVCTNITANEILEFDQPLIIKSTNESIENQFVVCYADTEGKGFLVHGPENNLKNLTMEEFLSVWTDRTGIAFINSFTMNSMALEYGVLF